MPRRGQPLNFGPALAARDHFCVYEYCCRVEAAYGLQDVLLLRNLLIRHDSGDQCRFPVPSTEPLERTLAKVVLALYSPYMWLRTWQGP